MSSSPPSGDKRDSNNWIESLESIRLGKMPLKHKTIARVETHSLTVVRATGEPVNFWCEACGATTAMVTPERAAEIMKTNPRGIYQQVERGEVHFVETGGGELLICCSSLRVETRTLSEGVNKYV